MKPPLSDLPAKPDTRLQPRPWPRSVAWPIIALLSVGIWSALIALIYAIRAFVLH